ncbi:MAG: restriction endonuclease subunit S [Sulfuriferula sp.]|nr:restriction endonuclease subunit S [Sulfuriferula sp.]
MKVRDVAKVNQLNVTASYPHSEIEYIDTASVTEGRVGIPQKISLSYAPSRAKRVVRHNDILISTVRPNLKHYGILKSPSENTVVSTGFAVITSQSISPDYLYRLLTTSWYTEFLSGIAESQQSNYPAFNPSLIENTVIAPPSLLIQKKIAAILTAYDELIEVNRRRIALLEKMAEEIYSEWFVRMRFPNHEKVKTVKGVPDEWKVKQFHEIVEYYIGGGWGEDDQSTSFSEAAYVIRGTDIPDIQAGEFEGCPYRFHKPSNLKSRSLQQGDFVFEVSGGSTNQLLGRNVFITEHLLKYFNAPVIAASFCKQIRFRRELVSPYFMKYFMKLYYDCDLVGIYQIQSTGISNYQFESFLKYQTIVLPPDELQKKFEDIVKPIIEMRDGISLANIGLRKARDLLLPRLISGKLSVENLDIQFPPSMAD